MISPDILKASITSVFSAPVAEFTSPIVSLTPGVKLTGQMVVLLQIYLTNSKHYHLIIDLVEQQAFVVPCKVADRFQATQWKQGVKQEKPLSLSSEEMEKWVEELEQQRLHFPSMDELTS